MFGFSDFPDFGLVITPPRSLARTLAHFACVFQARCLSATLSVVSSDYLTLHVLSLIIALQETSNRIEVPLFAQVQKIAYRYCIFFSPSKANANPTIGKYHGPLYRQPSPRICQERRAQQLDCAAIVEPQHLGDSQERADNIIITPNDKMYL